MERAALGERDKRQVYYPSQVKDALILQVNNL